MAKTYVTATELKHKTAEILNMVHYKKNIAVIKRHGKALAKIVPISSEKEPKKDLGKLIDKYFGALPDFPDVAKERRSRKRKIIL